MSSVVAVRTPRVLGTAAWHRWFVALHAAPKTGLEWRTQFLENDNLYRDLKLAGKLKTGSWVAISGDVLANDGERCCSMGEANWSIGCSCQRTVTSSTVVRRSWEPR